MTQKRGIRFISLDFMLLFLFFFFFKLYVDYLKYSVLYVSKRKGGYLVPYNIL